MNVFMHYAEGTIATVRGIQGLPVFYEGPLRPRLINGDQVRVVQTVENQPNQNNTMSDAVLFPMNGLVDARTNGGEGFINQLEAGRSVPFRSHPVRDEL
jgi:hypothetical protein